MIVVNHEVNFTAQFKTTYGVKQGGNLSPDIYKIYTQPLAEMITQLKVGVLVKTTLVNILMYADDVILVSSSIKDAQAMLDVVINYSLTSQIKYNPSKTNMLVFSTKENAISQPKLYLCGEEIVVAKTIKYLGIMINNVLENTEHIQRRKTATHASLSNLISTEVLNSEMCVQTKIKLFMIYLKPLLFYGLESLDLTQKHFE